MDKFEILLGIKKSKVKNTCILLPFLRKDIIKDFGVKEFLRGKLYASGNAKFFTLIHTGIGVTLLGDAVLYLGQTACQNILLFGSCGLVKSRKGIKIGGLVSPYKCYPLESFTQVLSGYFENRKAIYADRALLKDFFRLNEVQNIKEVTCATFGSLELEEENLDLFTKNDIDVVDMECSALFAASAHIKRKTLALLYITDIINEKPFYVNLSLEDKSSLSSSIKNAINILCGFTKKIK